MRLVTPPKSAVPFGLSAMKMVAAAAPNGIVEPHRAVRDAVQRAEFLRLIALRAHASGI